jgi:hypothetical protein
MGFEYRVGRKIEPGLFSEFGLLAEVPFLPGSGNYQLCIIRPPN